MKTVVFAILFVWVAGVCNADGVKPFDKAKGYLENASTMTKEAQSTIEDIKIAYNTFKDKGTLDMILNGEQVDFPIEIISSDDDSKLSMILQSIKFTPSGGFATMYMRYEVGEGDKRQYLYFAGTDIGFSKSGGFDAGAKISLVASVNIGLGRCGAPKMKENSIKNCFSMFTIVFCQKFDL